MDPKKPNKSIQPSCKRGFVLTYLAPESTLSERICGIDLQAVKRVVYT